MNPLAFVCPTCWTMYLFLPINKASRMAFTQKKAGWMGGHCWRENKHVAQAFALGERHDAYMITREPCHLGKASSGRQAMPLPSWRRHRSYVCKCDNIMDRNRRWHNKSGDVPNHCGKVPPPMGDRVPKDEVTRRLKMASTTTFNTGDELLPPEHVTGVDIWDSYTRG